MGVPEYTKKASRDYNKRHDQIMVNAPLGTKDRIRAVTDKGLSAYIVDLILEDLERREAGDPSVASPVAPVYDYDDLPFA